MSEQSFGNRLMMQSSIARRWAIHLSALLFCLSAFTSAGAATLPAGFTETQISGLSNPTAMAIAPDGRIFVCLQTGQLRVIKNGALLPTPFVTLTVDPQGERGLLGVAFDPDYATNRFVYVYYTATTPATHNRVSRFTADIANQDVAAAGSEVVLLDLETLSATNHNGGAIHFGPDGKLYIATGENAVPSFSQSLANRLGKILRINSDGTIPADNPTSFPNIAGSPSGVNRAIWAVGLRNPFTFAFQPGTSRMFINDVGQSSTEEINDGIAGSNYGWPTCEGGCSILHPNFRDPLFQYGHGFGPTTGCAIAGGAFYNPGTLQFPAKYVGRYFFADLCSGWIRLMDPSNNTAEGFASGISQPVDLAVGSDGSLYYLARGSSAVFRVQYSGGSTLAINNLTITEGNSGTSVATFNVLLSPASAQTVTVNYTTANNTASASTDYVATGGTLTFPSGQQSQPISVTINGDTTFEPNETFNVNLSSPVNATIDDNQGVGTITDDDGPPVISINDVSVTEGASGTTTATFTVSLSHTSGQTVTANYATAGNTATSGTDFVAASGTASIASGQLSTTINVTVNSDITFEPAETFFVNLTNPNNGTLGDSQAIGTINNDDAEPTISINNVSVAEGNTGTCNAGFTVSLSNPSFQTITVNYATANDTAIAGTHYVSTSGTLTFTPGTTTQPVNVQVNGDLFNEAATLTFNLNLSAATNATISDSQGVGTILDDDNPVLATEENSQRAIALNSFLFLRDPFSITNPGFLNTDPRTRVALFATNLTVTQGLVVTAQAVDSQQTVHQLSVEFVGSLSTFAGFTQVNVKLPDGITVAGDLQVSITVNGRTSNVVLVGVTP
ncbi:MAG TPA: PQQ-dependent sugar dehydrogenase [Pyrinomonadaceae bacterium]|nr:PQQ-dependent sugar dehydrogenase [Pyrinomonadaceae bacterium]